MSDLNSTLKSSLRETAHQIKLLEGDPFGGARRAYIARAPGRLDVMGGVADYSGSLVMETTVGPGAFVAAALIPERIVRIHTVLPGDSELVPNVQIPLEELQAASHDDLQRISIRLLAEPGTRWAALVAGCVPLLMLEAKATFEQGLAVLVRSEVPIAEGVASSAAVEVASMSAISACLKVELEPQRLAELCQQVENKVAAAPCGIMDQMTAALGREGAFLRLKCDPATVEGYVPVPEQVKLFGINSGVKHSVAGSRYADARIGAFIAAAVLKDNGALGARGSLCDLSVAEYRKVRALLPREIRGDEFASSGLRYSDTATRVSDCATYRPRQSADHAVYENERVTRFAELLGQADADSLARAGALMYASHWSYTANARLGSSQTDLLVRLLRRLGKQAGVLGAKITGGGCGGTVAVMAARPVEEVFQRVCDRYQEATGLKPALIAGTSPGAFEFGVHGVDI